MTLAEKGLFLECVNVNYEEGSIPSDVGVLRRTIGADANEFADAWPTVFKHFSPKKGTRGARLTNPQVEKDFTEKEAYSKRQSEFSMKRWKKARSMGTHTVPIRHPKGTHTVPQGDPIPARAHSTSKEVEAPKKRKPIWRTKFQEWWKIYPRKISEGKALDEYFRSVRNGEAKNEDHQGLLEPYPDFESRHLQLLASTRAHLPDFTLRKAAMIPYPHNFLGNLDWTSTPTVTKPLSDMPVRRSWEDDDVYAARIARGGAFEKLVGDSLSE